MVSPVVGPITKPVQDTYVKYLDINGTPRSVLVKRVERTGYRQKKPYNLNLPAYHLSQIAREGPADSRSPSAPPSVQSYGNLIWWDNAAARADAYNQAYARLVGAMGENAGMAINLAQHKQSMSMISTRALQLYNFTRHLRRFEFSRAADDLGISRKRVRDLTLRKEAKGLGNNWLEFHFGWSPLIHDVGTAIDILQSPVPPSRISGFGRGSASLVQKTKPVNTNYVNYVRKFDIKIRLGAEISVSNPNLWLANRLGFVNPATVLWDSVPFSFVVDWFVNVSQVIGSYTDFAGVSVQNSYNTVFWRSQYYEDWSVFKPVYTKKVGGVNTSMTRSYGIGSGPILKVKKPWQVSATRGATAISLLLQQLRR